MGEIKDKSDSKDFSAMLKKGVKAFILYNILHYGLLCAFPSVFRYYLRYWRSFDPVMPADAPKDITPVREVFGVHNYDELKKYMGDDVIIFRNYTDCASTFNNIVYPRRKDQLDNYVKISYNPEGPGNSYAPGVTKGEIVTRSLKEVFKRADPYEFASFLKIFHSEDYKVLLKAGPDDDFAFDSSFISHFKEPIVSTGIHAAPVAQTLSLQCEGTKAWVLWRSSDLDKYGIYTVASPQGQVMTGDPESILKIPTKIAKVYPNDLMYFPPLYYHAVATNPGRNVMFAIRKVDRKSLIRSFRASMNLTISWFLRYCHTQLHNNSAKRGFFENKDRFPFKDAIFEEVVSKQFKTFANVDTLDDFGLDEMLKK